MKRIERITSFYQKSPFTEVIRAYGLKERWDGFLLFKNVREESEEELIKAIELSLLLYTANHVLREYWKASTFAVKGKWEYGGAVIKEDSHGIEALRRFAVLHNTLPVLKAPYVGMEIRGVGWQGNKGLLFLTFQGEKGIKANPYFRKLRAYLKKLNAHIFMLNPTYNPYCHKVPCAFPKGIYKNHFEGTHHFFLFSTLYPSKSGLLPAFSYAFYPLFSSWIEEVLKVFEEIMVIRKKEGYGKKWYGNRLFLFPSFYEGWLNDVVVEAASLKGPSISNA